MPSETPGTLAEYAVAIVSEPAPAEKVNLARMASGAWGAGAIPVSRKSQQLCCPDTPGRPSKPELISPRDMPRRRIGSQKGLIALVHSLCHIELNAIDLAWDMIGRFSDVQMPHSFFDGAVKVGLDEANHFHMINRLLEDLRSHYGALPAHGGLWEAAQDTSHDLLARLAIVPLVLEARGLDVSPAMIKQVKSIGAQETARVFEIIYQDEITHVAFGAKWFKYLCKRQGLPPKESFQALVRQHFRGGLKPPFNEEARSRAGLAPGFYRPLIKM